MIGYHMLSLSPQLHYKSKFCSNGEFLTTSAIALYSIHRVICSRHMDRVCIGYVYAYGIGLDTYG